MEQILLDNKIASVLSEITGHDQSSLDTNMRLDADIGVDSIKQISVLQRIVDLIPDNLRNQFIEDSIPDKMRCADTLGELMQTVNHWLNNSISVKETVSSDSNNASKVENIVLKVISDVTGFKEDELEYELRLDQDLGIDSIKQITLINRLGDAFSDEKQNSLAHLLENGSIMKSETVADLVTIISESINNDIELHEPNVESKSSQTNEAKSDIPVLLAQYQHIISHYAMDSTTLCSKLEIDGDLNVEALHKAWGKVVERHPALRLIVNNSKTANRLSELIFNEIVEISLPDIELIDIRNMNESDKNVKIEGAMSEQLMLGWDLEKWPLHKLVLFRYSDTKYHLFLSIHHLVTDGIGNQIFLRELLAIYNGLVSGEMPELSPSLNMQEYIDAVKKMNQSDDSANTEKLSEFLKKQGKEQFKWHPEGKNVSSSNLKMKSSLFKLNKEETSTLQANLAEMRVSLNSILVANLLRVTSRKSSSSNRFFVNIPTSGRIYEDIEMLGTVSDFAQNIVMDFDCNRAQEEWVEWTRYVHSKIQDSLADGYDRLMIKQVASLAKETPLINGELPSLQRQVLSSGIKSNLYLSCVGESGIHSSYKSISVNNYHPATVTVRGGIDNLVELFDGQLHWSINYDSSVISEELIEELGRELIQELKQIKANSSQKDEVNKTTKTMAHDLNKNTISRVKEMVRELIHRNVSDSDFSRNLEAELGINSLQRIRLTMRMRRYWDGLEPSQLLKCNTLNEMINIISIASNIEVAGDILENYDSILSVHAAVTQQCAKTPDAIAIKDGNKLISYEELDKKSNQIAHYLVEQGVQRNDLVAVMMERGATMVISILGILKAGAAYVPMDINYPSERLSYILNHSDSKILLTQLKHKELIEQVCCDANLKAIVCPYDEIGQNIQVRSKLIGQSSIQKYTDNEAPDINCSPDDSMTVLYTSGSTGKPKGVLLGHAGYLNRIFWMGDALSITENDNIAFKTSCCFDISVWEIFLPLMYGATLKPVEKETVSNPWALTEWMNKESITIMHFVPSLFGEFLTVAEEENHKFNSLRWLVFSGEALPVDFIRRWIDKYGHSVELANLYGPTEASIDVTAQMIKEKPTKQLRRIPIGKPLPNTDMLILDSNMQECKPGEVGELYIAGVQLAKGYLKDSITTQKSFLDNPFKHIAGDKIYHTGDLATWLDDGSIDYRGRKTAR